MRVWVDEMSRPAGDTLVMRTVTVSATVLVEKVVPTPLLRVMLPEPSALPLSKTVTVTGVSAVGSPFSSRARTVMKLAAPTVSDAGEGVRMITLRAGRAVQHKAVVGYWGCQETVRDLPAAGVDWSARSRSARKAALHAIA